LDTSIGRRTTGKERGPFQVLNSGSQRKSVNNLDQWLRAAVWTKISDMLEWQVRSVRFTIFLQPTVQISSTVWQEITGHEPETSLAQKNLGIRQESGAFADGKLTVTIQPMRLDLQHEPADPAPSAVLGTFPSALDALRALIGRWLESGGFPGAQRLALGVILRAPVPDVRTGYNELRSYLRAVPEAEDATDFLYQVNRPRDSDAGVSGLRINRLSKWSVSGWQTVVVSSSGQLVGGPLQFACNLELDINTAPEPATELTIQAVPRIVDDLIAGATEVVEGGERL
jgi:hypothetical protein